MTCYLSRPSSMAAGTPVGNVDPHPCWVHPVSWRAGPLGCGLPGLGGVCRAVSVSIDFDNQPRGGRSYKIDGGVTEFPYDRQLRSLFAMVDQLFNSSAKRLARLLLLPAQFGGSGKPRTVIPKLSQQTQ